MYLGGRQNPDFKANLKYLTTEEGGRKLPAFSKFRPIVEFPGYEMRTSGEQTFIDKEIVYPGDSVQAEITILSVDYFKGKLFIGQTFNVWDGSTIATGVILEIINKDLEKV